MKICICGSTKFKKQIEEVAQALTLRGHVVTRSEIFTHQDNCEDLTEEQITMLTMVHAQKILEADKIFVVNVDQYIGSSTNVELEFAEANDKEILCYCQKYEYYNSEANSRDVYLEFWDGRESIFLEKILA